MKEELYTLVGKNIQKIREENNINQARLAEILGLSRTSVSNMENGRHPIFLHHIYTISDHMNIPLEKILPAVSEVDKKENRQDSIEKALLERGIDNPKTIESILSAIKKD